MRSLRFTAKDLRNLALGPLAFILLASCGRKDVPEDKFEVILKSNSPLVRETARTVGGTVINPNWFDVGFNVINETGRSVRVEEVLFYITVNGEEVGPRTMDLGSLSFSTENENYEYTGYCVYPPSTLSIPFSACANGQENPTAPDPLAVGVIMLISDLPVVPPGSNLAFPVRMEIKGVFLDSSGRDEDRFEKTVYFTTR